MNVCMFVWCVSDGHEMKTIEETMSKIHLETNHRKINFKN
jgi:hypothetical protein